MSGTPSTSQTSNNANPNANPLGMPDSAEVEDDEPKGIDYDHVEEPDSVLLHAVYRFQRSTRLCKIDTFFHPSMEPYGVAYPDPQHHVFAPYYLSAGQWGHPHRSLWIEPYLGSLSPNGFLSFVGPSVFSGYAYEVESLPFFQTLRPYTLLGYGGSLNKDNLLRVVHTQNINPRWNVAFHFQRLGREGVLTRSGVGDNSFGLTTNYYSPDARYQLQGAFVFNDMSFEENGGVASDDQYRQSGLSNLAGIPVVLYDATGKWRSLEAYLHQSFNTVLQFDKVKARTVKVAYDSVATRRTEDTTIYDTLHLHRDSITGFDTLLASAPKVLNSGVWGLDVSFARQHSLLKDMQGDASLYPIPVPDDSIKHEALYNHLRLDLYWTNDAYNDVRWHNPFKLTVGLSAQYQDWLQGNTFVLAPFAKATALLGRCRLEATADYDLLQSDYLTTASFHLPFGFQLGAKASASQPMRIYALPDGNEQSRVQQLFASYSMGTRIFEGGLEMAASRVEGIYWLEALQPHFSPTSTLLLQARLMGSLRLGWLHYDMQHLLQHADQALFRCPLYASKNSLYADFHLFSKALHVNAGFDLRYHTAFYADAYSPLLTLFYRQDDVQVGRYPWLDAFVTLRIRQATIYVRATHINYFLAKERRDFLLPHYPGEDLGVFFGVNWQFFN